MIFLSNVCLFCFVFFFTSKRGLKAYSNGILFGSKWKSFEMSFWLEKKCWIKFTSIWGSGFLSSVINSASISLSALELFIYFSSVFCVCLCLCFCECVCRCKLFYHKNLFSLLMYFHRKEFQLLLKVFFISYIVFALNRRGMGRGQS